MGDSKISGFWKWLLVLLVVCNLGLIITIWVKPQKEMMGHDDDDDRGHGRFGHRGHMPHGPINFDRELNLTEEQRRKFDDLRDTHQQKIDSIKRMAGAVREQFFDNLNAPVADSAKLMALDNQLGDYHRRIELMTFNHFKEVRGILDDKQKELFDKYIKMALKRMPEQPHVRGDGGMGPHDDRNRDCGPEGRPMPPEGAPPMEPEEEHREHR